MDKKEYVIVRVPDKENAGIHTYEYWNGNSFNLKIGSAKTYETYGKAIINCFSIPDEEIAGKIKISFLKSMIKLLLCS